MERKLTIVHTESSLGWGGQEIRILTESQGLRERGHRVTLLCPRASRIYGEAASRGLPVVDLPIARKRLAGLRAVYRWLEANRIDVVNTHSSTDSWLVALASTWLSNAAPIVRTRHISPPVPDNWPTRWLYRKAARHVITTGEMLRQQLIRDVGLSAHSVTSVPTGVDTRRFAPGDRDAARASLGLPTGVPIVGIVATLRSWKGHAFLIDAVAMLDEMRARLLIVGDGPQRAALEAQVRDLGLGARVVFAGEQADVLPWLRALDVFVLPSYANEGVPQAIVQAMLCGLPVVSTPTGSIEEAVRHGETGILVPPKQPREICRVLRELLGDVERRRALGARARAYAVERFGHDRMLDRMEEIYRRALTATAP